ncbi:Urease operon accessory protein [Ensifer soli]|uniref:Urease operon accessory protein n=1 Tax=Ciceribacter sp. sgz301302 TaxID=3342379 RepID=UPI0035B7B7DD
MTTAGRLIAIVGNGRVPEGCARTIDAADLVIRFNECGSIGPGGARTDVIAVCNTGRPALAMLAGGRWKAKHAVLEAVEIWCTRDRATFAALRAPLRSSHPDLDDFCDDYTDGYAAFAAATGKRLKRLDAAVHRRTDAALAAFAPEAYVVPSSGLLVIAEVLANVTGADDRVVLAGFGHQGWIWHPFAAERRYVDHLVSEGRLARLHPLI